MLRCRTGWGGHDPALQAAQVDVTCFSEDQQEKVQHLGLPAVDGAFSPSLRLFVDSLQTLRFVAAAVREGTREKRENCRGGERTCQWQPKLCRSSLAPSSLPAVPARRHGVPERAAAPHRDFSCLGVREALLTPSFLSLDSSSCWQPHAVQSLVREGLPAFSRLCSPLLVGVIVCFSLPKVC